MSKEVIPLPETANLHVITCLGEYDPYPRQRTHMLFHVLGSYILTPDTKLTCYSMSGGVRSVPETANLHVIICLGELDPYPRQQT